MQKGKVKFITLGCRVNQYDTEGMRELLTRKGFESFGADNRLEEEPVDLVVINTCTVTEEADRESRYWMRRARRRYPQAKIVVTGCGVTRNRREIESMPEVDLVLENWEKADIAGRIALGCGHPEMQEGVRGPGPFSSLSSPLHSKHDYTPLSISRMQGHGRAFVKIQDGCNHACSFCKVVLARGRSRSRPFKDILEEVVRLRDAGYREMVFAGIQLGAYGLDLDVGAGFPRPPQGEETSPLLEDVLYECAKIQGIERLRLSSIEPVDVRPELIEALRDIPQCVPHLHIPLQSGDDEILKRMNRRYGRSYYLELVDCLKSELEDFALSLDVMAGFPGETDEEFSRSVDVLVKVMPVKCHVFPYSPRDGTRASLLRDLPGQVIRQRVRTLIETGDRLARAFKGSYVGRVMPVLVEQVKPFSRHPEPFDRHPERSEGSQVKLREGSFPEILQPYRPQDDGRVILQGLTENFIKVRFEGEESLVGQMVPVHLLEVQGEVMLGRQEGGDL